MTVKLTAAQKITILNADDVFSIMQQVLLREKKIDRDKEHFWLVCLSASNQILMVELIGLGSMTSVVVEPMDVFSFALQKRAAKIIMVHNHPSGRLNPSKADELLTEKMMAIGVFLQLPVIDHLIISEKDFYSFEVSGLLAMIAASTRIDLTFKHYDAYNKRLEDHRKRTARTLLQNGINIKTIIKATRLTKEEVEELLPKKNKKTSSSKSGSKPK